MAADPMQRGADCGIGMIGSLVISLFWDLGMYEP